MASNNSINAKQQGMQYQSSAGAWSGIDAGTSGNVLTSNGTGVAPSFQVPSSSGNTVFITSVTTTAGQTNADLTGITNAYDNYFVMYYNVVSQTNAVQLQLQLSSDGGSTFVSTGYYQGGLGISYLNIQGTDGVNNGSAWSMAGSNISNNAAFPSGGSITIYGLAQSTYQTTYNGLTFAYIAIGPNMHGGAQSAVASYNALRFKLSSGNFAAGCKFKLYGLVN